MSDNKVSDIKNNNKISGAILKGNIYQGPIPPAEELNKYKEISPDFPSIIVKMAVDEQRHSHKIETKIVGRGTLSPILGQVFAFITILTSIIASVYLIMNGHAILEGSICYSSFSYSNCIYTR